jgi:HECT-domain (ubiquitin-transferase)
MIRDFSNKERQLLLKFITGSSRLGPNRHVNLNFDNDSDCDNRYPVGHTCGESVDIFNYSTLEIMKDKFRTAILTCGEIDDDGDYYGSESEESN